MFVKYLFFAVNIFVLVQNVWSNRTNVVTNKSLTQTINCCNKTSMQHVKQKITDTNVREFSLVDNGLLGYCFLVASVIVFGLWYLMLAIYKHLVNKRNKLMFASFYFNTDGSTPYI